MRRARKARQKGRSLDPSGYDSGKKVLGRKRHVLVDTQGLLLDVDAHAADIQIVKRSDVGGFVVLPKRWIVERTLAWISRNRRLSRDYERHTRIATAFVRLAICSDASP